MFIISWLILMPNFIKNGFFMGIIWSIWIWSNICIILNVINTIWIFFFHITRLITREKIFIGYLISNYFISLLSFFSLYRISVWLLIRIVRVLNRLLFSLFGVINRILIFTFVFFFKFLNIKNKLLIRIKIILWRYLTISLWCLNSFKLLNFLIVILRDFDSQLIQLIF